MSPRLATGQTAGRADSPAGPDMAGQQWAYPLPSTGIPLPYGTVIADRRQPAGSARTGQEADVPQTSAPGDHGRSDLAAGHRVPHPYGSVVARGGHTEDTIETG
jgi:hypothetical protein